jgi:hypothetical protein
MAEVRIATFNLENFDETAPTEWPSLAERIQRMRPQIVRLRANIAYFQEVNGQERPNQPRSLLALADLLAGTKPWPAPNWRAPEQQTTASMTNGTWWWPPRSRSSVLSSFAMILWIRSYTDASPPIHPMPPQSP